MKLRSFRLRIALLFAMLAGSTVASFGGISWWLIYDAKVSRLNAKLEAVLSRPHPPIKDIGPSLPPLPPEGKVNKVAMALKNGMRVFIFPSL